MYCHHCKQKGTPCGVYYSPSGKTMFIKFRCLNKQCEFIFDSAVDVDKDGKPLKLKGRPKWAASVNEVK